MASVPISISGDDERNVQEVEKKLRIIKSMKKIPKKHIGFIIGKSGQRIKDIMDRAKLLKIEFEDTSSSNDNKFLLLYGKEECCQEAEHYIDIALETHKELSLLQEEIVDLDEKTSKFRYENGFSDRRKKREDEVQRTPQKFDQVPSRDRGTPMTDRGGRGRGVPNSFKNNDTRDRGDKFEARGGTYSEKKEEHKQEEDGGFRRVTKRDKRGGGGRGNDFNRGNK